jgi:hypothetical protein
MILGVNGIIGGSLLPSPLLTGLIGSWSLNNNANDNLGLNNGVATNVTYATGQFNKAGVFNLTGKIVTSDFAIINSSTRFSVSFWVNLTSTAGTNDLVTKWNYGTNGSWVIRATGSAIEFAVADSVTDLYNNAVYTASGALTAGNWANVICTYDGTQSGNTNRAKIYVNNVSLGSLSFGTIPGTTTSGTHPVTFGEFPTAINRLVGMLDEVNLWSRILSASERVELQSKAYPFI